MTSKRLSLVFVALPLHWLGSRGFSADFAETTKATGGGSNVAKEDRGFASMDRAKQREIASKGGKAAHQKGTAHEWTSEEARDAGRKGGIASHRRRREQMAQGSPATDAGSGANESNVTSEAGADTTDR